MSLQIKEFQFNMFGVNTYMVWDPDTKDAAIIDPGMITERECGVLDDFISNNSLKIRHLITTHLHIDHTFGVDYVEERYGVSLMADVKDEFLGQRRLEQARMFGLPASGVSPLKIGHRLTDGEHIRIGNGELVVLEVPGHSPGSVALYAPDAGFVITGDALFQGSIGRTDLPGGDHSELIGSIRGKLFTLPDGTRVYPGHGPSTTIGYEKRMNPYF